MLPQLRLLSLTIHRTRTCNTRDKKPVQISEIPDARLHVCSAHNLQLSLTLFRDTEDAYDLSYRIVYVDKKLAEDEVYYL